MQKRISLEEQNFDNSRNHMQKAKALSLLKDLRAEQFRMIEVLNKIDN